MVELSKHNLMCSSDPVLFQSENAKLGVGAMSKEKIGPAILFVLNSFSADASNCSGNQGQILIADFKETGFYTIKLSPIEKKYWALNSKISNYIRFFENTSITKTYNLGPNIAVIKKNLTDFIFFQLLFWTTGMFSSHSYHMKSPQCEQNVGCLRNVAMNLCELT